MKREHPITILKYSGKSVWLLIFPLLRGLQSVKLEASALYYWVRGVWFDLLVIAVILGVGFLRWRYVTFLAEQDCFRCHSGIFVRREVEIPYRNLASVTAEQPLWLRPLFAVRLKLDTRAGIVKTSNLKLLVRRGDYRAIAQRLNVGTMNVAQSVHYRPRWWMIAVFSVVFSSSLSGAVYLATFFFQSGRTLDRMLETDLAAWLTAMTAEVTAEISGRLAVYVRYIEKVPPVIIGIGVALLAAWLLSFLRNMARYIGFRYEQNPRQVRIRTGLFTRRCFFIRSRLVNYLDLRQNLLMKLCCVMSVNLSCAGYGTVKQELPVLIPVIPRRRLMSLDQPALIQPLTARNQFRPSLVGFLKFLWGGILLACAEPLVIALLQELWPHLSGYLKFALVMLEIPTLWLVVVKLGAWLTTGVSLQGNCLCIRYCRGFGFHTILADTSRLAKVSVQISLFQRLNHKCDVRFYFHDQLARAHPVLGLSQQDADTLLALLREQQNAAAAAQKNATDKNVRPL